MNGSERYDRMLENAENYRRTKVFIKNRSKVQVIKTIRQFIYNQSTLDSGQPADNPA
jgi:hypothetical protein